MTDDQGVLGNLPRSRPGQRSEKRAPRGERAAKSTTLPKPAAGPRRAAGSAAGERRPSPPAGSDPVRGAIRGVAGIALTGAKVATGVTREVLRRLPRP
jgi:hypothetical protein